MPLQLADELLLDPPTPRPRWNCMPPGRDTGPERILGSSTAGEDVECEFLPQQATVCDSLSLRCCRMRLGLSPLHLAKKGPLAPEKNWLKKRREGFSMANGRGVWGRGRGRLTIVEKYLAFGLFLCVRSTSLSFHFPLPMKRPKPTTLHIAPMAIITLPMASHHHARSHHSCRHAHHGGSDDHLPFLCHGTHCGKAARGATRSKTEGTLAATLGSRERERATVTMSVKLHVHHVPVGDPLFEVLLGSVGGPDKVGTVSGMSDNDTLVALVHRCPHLKCIDLTESGEDITDSALMVVAVDCHGLEVLVLNNSSAITDDGLLAVVRNCRHLRTVLIKFCRTSRPTCQISSPV